MVKSELIKRSPLRIFEKALKDNLKKGDIAVLASRKGVGKTACLVHIATDKLMQDKHVIHVSFAPRVDHIIQWYEDIFKEIAKKRDLEGALDVHDEIIKNRVIMNFSQAGITADQVLSSLEVMIRQGNFPADIIIFDGLDFNKVSLEDLQKIKDFARQINLEIWISASLKNPEPVFDSQGMPTELVPIFSAIDFLITLRFEGTNVKLHLLKERDTVHKMEMNLILDPKTLLIVEEE